MTCGDLGKLLPELPGQYGDATPVSISAGFIEGDVQFVGDQGSATAKGSAFVTISVDGTTVLSATMNNGDASGAIYTQSQSIWGSIGDVSVGALSKYETTLGVDEETFHDRL